MLSGVSLGASYTLTNNKGPVNTNVLVDNMGAALTAGTAYVGFFSAADSVVQGYSTTADLIANFQVFTAGTDGSGAIPSAAPAVAGSFTTQGSGVDLTATNPFSGNNVYVLVIHGSAEQALVVKFDAQFASSEVTTTLNLEGSNTAGAGNDTVTGATVLVGGFDLFSVDPNTGAPGGTDNAAFSLGALAPIPEPTSTMLLALGSFAFVVRRRR